MIRRYLFIGGPCDGSVLGVDTTAARVRYAAIASLSGDIDDYKPATIINYKRMNLGSKANPQEVFVPESYSHGDTIRDLIGCYPRSKKHVE